MFGLPNPLRREGSFKKDSPGKRNLNRSVEKISMAYVSGNPKTKKEIKDALKAGKTWLTVFSPGLGTIPNNGDVSIEGPHYPEPHKWYGTATLKDGYIVKVK